MQKLWLNFDLSGSYSYVFQVPDEPDAMEAFQGPGDTNVALVSFKQPFYSGGGRRGSWRRDEAWGRGRGGGEREQGTGRGEVSGGGSGERAVDFYFFEMLQETVHF